MKQLSLSFWGLFSRPKLSVQLIGFEKFPVQDNNFNWVITIRLCKRTLLIHLQISTRTLSFTFSTCRFKFCLNFKLSNKFKAIYIVLKNNKCLGHKICIRKSGRDRTLKLTLVTYFCILDYVWTRKLNLKVKVDNVLKHFSVIYRIFDL